MEFRLGGLIVAAMVALAVSKPSGQLCGEHPTDMVFVLDASTSIWEPNFTKQLDFVGNIIARFDIGPGHDQTRFGVITFSDYSTVEFDLGAFGDLESTKNALESIPYQTGGTNTSDALKTARTRMFAHPLSGREEVVKIAVVITDGLSQNTAATSQEAMALKSAGVHVFAVGVGFGIDLEELTVIASSPTENYMFTVDDYSALDSIKGLLSTKTCDVVQKTTVANKVPQTVTPPTQSEESSGYSNRQSEISPTTLTLSSSTPGVQTEVSSDLPPKTTTPYPILGDEAFPELLSTKVCQGKPAEVFFLLDSSTSIEKQDFVKQTKFVQRVINLFDVSEAKTRVGLSTFSDSVQPVLNLGSLSTKAELISALNDVPYLGGETNTGDALRDMSQRGMAPEVIRQDVAHVAIMLTDGQSHDSVFTKEQALAAKSRGIYIFAIGIGDDVDKQELKDIASLPSERFVFHVRNYDALESIKDILAIRACQVDPTEQSDRRVCPSEPTDLTFLYDSGKLGSESSNRVSAIIRNLVGRLPMSETGFKFGVLADTCSQSVDISLTADRVSMASSLMQKDRRDLSDLIRDHRTNVIRPENGARHDSRKVAVIFVGGLVDDFGKTMAQVMRSKAKGVEIYVVALNEDVDKMEMAAIASDPPSTHTLYLSPRDHLLLQHESLEGLLCEDWARLDDVEAA